MSYHHSDETRKLLSETQPMRLPTDRRLRRADQYAGAVMWIWFLACLGMLIWSLLL